MESQGHIRMRLKAMTRPKQKIKVVGSHINLGSWNLSHGIELTTNTYSYPYWSTPIIILPLNQTIKYKYLIYSPDSLNWESIFDRKICLTQNNCVIEDIYNDPISKIMYSPISIDEAEEVFNEDISYDQRDSVLIVSFLLPITVTINPNGEYIFNDTKGVWKSQLYSTMMKNHIDFIWLGIAGVSIESEEEKEKLTQHMREKYRCIPIFINPNDIDLHEKFCSMILYKLFHNIVYNPTSGITQYNKELWNAYKRVNIFFADQILTHYTRQIIWIHGTELLLVPSFISRKTRDILNIGFFLHHPFPSSEIYRVFPNREAILHALCCCDLIGFHLFEYARNFFSCCKRILSIDIELTKGGYLGLNYYGRHIMVKSDHIGIHPEMIENICKEEDYLAFYEGLRKKYLGKKVLLNIDAPIELSGIMLKFKAFQVANKTFKHKVLFLQIIVSHTVTEETERIKAEIYSLQSSINEDAKEQLVEVIEQELTNIERFAYMSVSSGLIISCIKDGLCLQPFEYLIIKKKVLVELYFQNSLEYLVP